MHYFVFNALFCFQCVIFSVIRFAKQRKDEAGGSVLRIRPLSLSPGMVNPVGRIAFGGCRH